MFLFLACCTQEMAKDPSLSCQTEIEMGVVLESQDSHMPIKIKLHERSWQTVLFYMCTCVSNRHFQLLDKCPLFGSNRLTLKVGVLL